jgi:DNA-directed RNA polymerase subunit RPC12/RpoP
MSDRGIGVTNYSAWPNDTRERCPQCRSADILALGRVLADTTGIIRNSYRCSECAQEFLLLSTDRRIGPRDRRAPS